MSDILGAPMIQSSKKNVVLDATVLTSLMNCARFTDFRFNHNFTAIGGKSNSLEVGSLVHKVLEVTYSSIINGRSRSDSIILGMAAGELYIKGCQFCTNFTSSHFGHSVDEPCNETCVTKPSCGHIPNDYPGVVNTPQVPDKGYLIGWKHALDTCEQYFDFYKNDSWVPLEVEVVKSKILYEDDEIRILWKAKLDWVVDTNQGIYPVDHKTMKQRRQTTKLNNQFKGQCLIMGTRNMIVNKIGFQTTLKPEEKFQRSPVSYSAASLMEWQSNILPYYAKLLVMYNETGYWPPNYSNCEGKFGDCIFKGVCEADPEMREEELKLGFMIGPIWNPQNDNDKEND